MGQIASFRAAASHLLDRFRIARAVGGSYDGARDYNTVLGYDETISLAQYRYEYARGGISKRIVECYPKATWRGGVTLYEDEDPETETEFEAAWKALNGRLSIWTVLQRADILAGLSTYSVILLGAPGELDQELPKGKPEQLIYMQPFFAGGGPGASGNRSITSSSGADCTIAEFEIDPTNPRFGEPRTYQLRRTDISTPHFQKPVHWSRVIHIAEGCLDDNVFGVPILENIWNLLADLRKVCGGGAEAFWLRANQGLLLNLDKDVRMETADVENLKAEVDDYRHDISRVMRTRGMEVQTLGSDVANFNQPAEAILTQIAGSKGIPMRILTGSERGELASSQDAANFNTQVQDRRTGYAGPLIVRRLVDRLIEYGYLPKPKQYEIEWGVIETMSEMEKAKGAQTWAQTNATNPIPVYTDAEIREFWHGLEPLTEEQKEEMAPKPDPNAVDEGEITDPFEKKQAEAQARKKAALKTKEIVDEDGELKAAEVDPDAELIRALAAAIECGATEVVDAIVGLGGPGSGNFGHAGRPGEIGGSARASEISDADGWVDHKKVFGGQVDYDGDLDADLENESHSRLIPLKQLFATQDWTKVEKSASIAEKGKRLIVHVAKIGPDRWAILDGHHNAVAAYLRGDDSVMVRVHERTKLKGLGGPGSGFFDHKGRPGHEGGSARGTHTDDNDDDGSMLSDLRREAREIEATLPSFSSDSKFGELARRRLKRLREQIAELRANPQQRLLETDDDLTTLGGPGSGHFGHAGRPGKEGGSAPGKGSSEKSDTKSDTNESWIGKPSSAYTPMRPGGLDTKERFSDGRGNYTPDRTKLHDEIIAKYYRGTTAVDDPTAMILGGGMASGKTTLVESEGLVKENTVEVNVDKIRADLPELREALIVAIKNDQGISVAETHEEASDISRRLMRLSVEGKRNLVLDGTGDTTIGKLGGKIAEMRAQGHRVIAEYVTMPVALAQVRADERARTTDRRFVAPTAMKHVHRAVSQIFPEAIRQGLFDEARLWNTNVPRGSKPILVASAQKKKMTVYNNLLWNEFIKKGTD